MYNILKINKTKYIVVFFILSVVLLVAVIIFNFLSSARIKIVAPKNSSVYLLEIKNNEYQKILKGKGNTSLTIKPGFTTFIVEENEKSTKQSVNAEASREYVFDMTPKSLKKISVASSVTATDLQIDGDKLNYLNPVYELIETVSLGKSIPSDYNIFPQPITINSIDWEGESTAIVNFDESLGVLNNSKLQRINFRDLELIKNKSEVIFSEINDFSANNSLNLVASIGNSLVYKKSPFESTTKILQENIQGQYVYLDVSNNGYYAYCEGQYNSDTTGELGANPKSEISKDIKIYKLDNNSPIETIRSNSDVIGLKFNNPGNKIAYSNSQGLQVYDLNKKSNSILYTKLIAKPNLITWVDENKLVYSDSEGLWLADIDELQSIRLSKSDEITYLQDMHFDKVKKRFFYSVIIPNPQGDKGKVYYFSI